MAMAIKKRTKLPWMPDTPALRFFRLKQKFEGSTLGDPAAATHAALASLPAAGFIRPGMTVAVGAGSRGIANHAAIVRMVCEELKSLGARPFIVPAMGSHGGATDCGQLDVLAHFGITEAQMAVPIRSSMDPVELGRAGPLVVYQDRNAAGADAIVLVNRIKPHTDFHGPIESGLMKMAAMGLGKQKGAQQLHQAMMRMGGSAAVLEVARAVLRLGKISFGVGIIENQLHQTARVVAVPAATGVCACVSGSTRSNCDTHSWTLPTGRSSRGVASNTPPVGANTADWPGPTNAHLPVASSSTQ